MKVFISLMVLGTFLGSAFHIGVMGGPMPQPRLWGLAPPEGFVAEQHHSFTTVSDQDEEQAIYVLVNRNAYEIGQIVSTRWSINPGTGFIAFDGYFEVASDDASRGT